MDIYDFPYRPDMRPDTTPDAAPDERTFRIPESLVAALIITAWLAPVLTLAAALQFKAVACSP